MSPVVPNSFPRHEPSGPARIAIVGEAPGKDEVFYGAPFVGESGRLLDGALGHVGIARGQCFVGNVCQHRPGEDNDFNRFDWNGPEVQAGVAQLKADLERFKPTMVLCLGNAALHLFKHGNVAPLKGGGKRAADEDDNGRAAVNGEGGSHEAVLAGATPASAATPKRGAFQWPSKIGSWRGSLFWSEWAGVKCMAAYHPAALTRDYSLQAYYRCAPGVGDLERLAVESRRGELVLPNRFIEVYDAQRHTLDDSLHVLDILRQERRPVSCDIEGGPGDVTSIAFSLSATGAVVIPLAHIDGSSVWSEAEEVEIWQAVKALLEDPTVPKIAQNGSYDFFALAWTYGIVPAGVVEDTMEQWWELFAELDKGLDTLASLLTLEPFYKPDREKVEGKTVLKFESDEQFWRYNGLDACVTFECWERMNTMLLPGQRAHFRFNSELFYPKLYQMLRGLLVDEERRAEMRAEAERGVWELQAKVDQVAAEQDGLGELSEFYAYFEAGEMTERHFAQLCLAQLGGKNPRREQEVVVERWQPMRWNGKKWVKGGQMVDGETASALQICGAYLNIEPCEAEREKGWLKPAHKTTTRLLPFTPATLAEVEEHVLESKRGEWKRVKKLWKELKHERRSDGGTLADGAGEAEPAGSMGEAGAGRGDASPPNGRSALLGELSTLLNSSADQQTEIENRPDRRGVQASSRPALLGELSTLLNLAVNIGSTGKGGDAQEFLFQTCALPAVYVNQRGDYSVESPSLYKKRKESSPAKPPGSLYNKSLSTDQNALDRLYVETQDVRVLWCLQQRRLRMVVSDLSKELDADGRMRFSVSLVKETGRMATSKSPLSTGTNPQGWNKDLRRVVVADPGCELGQFDLKGADSWTVAAECAALGDPTMLEDLKAGVKPAEVVCLVYQHGAVVNGWSREEIVRRAKEEKAAWPGWLYPASKSAIHGSCYGAGWRTVRDTILKYSMADLPLELGEAKPLVLSKAQTEQLQAAVFARYPGLKRWHEAEGRGLVAKGYIQTSAGHVRRFYGRKAERKGYAVVANHETLKELLASKPQYYTTLATKRALHALWYDEANRREDGSLRVEPLLCVHDALNPQWRVEDREFAGRKLLEWFSQELVIAGQRVVIPVDGVRGADWGMKEGEKL